MALFGSKKKEKSTDAAPTLQTASAGEVANIIRRPHVTEKAALVAERGVYVFEVDRNATKREVAHAISKIYNVQPVRVNIVRRSSRVSSSRMRRFDNRQSSMKKAYVYLKEGDRIEFA